jgi:hypothetical protein
MNNEHYTPDGDYISPGDSMIPELGYPGYKASYNAQDYALDYEHNNAQSKAINYDLSKAHIHIANNKEYYEAQSEALKSLEKHMRFAVLYGASPAKHIAAILSDSPGGSGEIDFTKEKTQEDILDAMRELHAELVEEAHECPSLSTDESFESAVDAALTQFESLSDGKTHNHSPGQS